ncbi:aldehyde dehydrogenase family protein [Microbacterium elymi]|uniref:aldehyde dehydrogenase family protein n=1 Tax=Microbacterium elymi TaxID=2909587 RepID=UPI00338F97B1
MNEDDAIGVANDSLGGTGGSVWTANPKAARRVAGQPGLRLSQRSCRHPPGPLAPFGGMRQSGMGALRGFRSSTSAGRHGIEGSAVGGARSEGRISMVAAPRRRREDRAGTSRG